MAIMKLSEENVRWVFINCLLKPEEAGQESIKAEGIKSAVDFHPERLRSAIPDIASMLSELPTPFMATGGGGWTFLNMCDTETGDQWASLHQIMDELVMLGLGTELLSYLMPRDMWPILPGGMPYIVIKPLTDYVPFHSIDG